MSTIRESLSIKANDAEGLNQSEPVLNWNRFSIPIPSVSDHRMSTTFRGGLWDTLGLLHGMSSMNLCVNRVQPEIYVDFRIHQSFSSDDL